MKLNKSVFANLFIVLIALLSFFTFSENFFPLLNSDMAVNILMTPSFSFPHDIYFWGQDRSGNLIPMLAHGLYLITGWQPVLLVSMVHYLLLAAGFWALCRFVKSSYGRVVIALLWFFPPWHFIEFLLILYGIQVSCVLIALNFLDRSMHTSVRWKCLAWLSSACFIFILSTWVSDMALISAAALVFMAVLYFMGTQNIPDKKISWRGARVPAMLILAWAIAGFLLLHFAKSVSTPVQVYNEGFLATPSSMIRTLNTVLDSVYRVLVFSSESIVESLFAWGLVISLTLLVFSGKSKMKPWLSVSENPWFWFFFLEAVITLAAVLSSRWVASNDAARRYFTTFFMSAWISLILWFENLPESNWKKSLKVLFAVVIITGSLSGSVRFWYPEIKPSRIRVLSSLRSMGDIGIIAEYWNSYLSASPDPIHIKATPHDKDYVRNRELVKEVFDQPKLYLIKDGWLETFPDSLVQFGCVLKRKGPAIHIADAWLNRYEVVR